MGWVMILWTLVVAMAADDDLFLPPTICTPTIPAARRGKTLARIAQPVKQTLHLLRGRRRRPLLMGKWAEPIIIKTNGPKLLMAHYVSITCLNWPISPSQKEFRTDGHHLLGFSSPITSVGEGWPAPACTLTTSSGPRPPQLLSLLRCSLPALLLPPLLPPRLPPFPTILRFSLPRRSGLLFPLFFPPHVVWFIFSEFRQLSCFCFLLTPPSAAASVPINSGNPRSRRNMV